MLIHWIWFATRPGLSDRDRRTLLERFRDPEEIYYSDSAAIERIEGLREEAREALEDKILLPAEEILEQCARKKIHILTYRDAAYPARLKNIADPPAILYYKGTLPDFDGVPLIAVVGTRKASAYGLGAAKRMGYQIGRCGGIVVSGMAYGIDGMAMRGALTAGQPVVGVLGCGVDVVYPASNRGLYEDLEKNGCLLSEFPPETPPHKWNFPKRNRIISGLCNGVLVVEAPEKSGALITARQGADQGRDVFVVPGNIDVASCAGSNALLRDGAIAVSSGWDVVGEYAHQYPGKVHRDLTGSRQAGYADEVKLAAAEQETAAPKVAQKSRIPGEKSAPAGRNDKKAIDNPAPAPYHDLNENQPTLTAEERSLMELLRDGERLVDEVIAQADMPASRALAALTMLEIKGVTVTLPGRRVCLKAQKP